MRASFVVATCAAALLSCGGKVIFDTGSSAGGATSGTTFGQTSTAVTSSHASAVTGNSVVSGVTTTGITTVAVTTGTGSGCADKGAPPGSTAGTTDCGFMPCGPSSTCFAWCSALYDCGLVDCGAGGAPLCPGFKGTAGEHDAFVTGMSGCAQACMQNPGVKSLVDPTDCPNTIQAISAAAPAFQMFCQGGFGG